MIYVIEAIKRIYPSINGGYVYWLTKHDGSEWTNPIDGLNWENTEYEKPAWEQIEYFFDEIELEEIKNKKLEELNNYYSSDECWMFKVVYNNSSLTKSADWYAKMIPACIGRQITLFEDSGNFTSIDLTEEMANNLNYQIQAVMSLRILKAKKECEKIINLATIDGFGELLDDEGNKIKEFLSKEELENLDIKSFLGEVPRVVDLNSL